MMRKIAIGLVAAALVTGASTLSASAIPGGGRADLAIHGGGDGGGGAYVDLARFGGGGFGRVPRPWIWIWPPPLWVRPWIRTRPLWVRP